jgi:hypothetical protein
MEKYKKDKWDIDVFSEITAWHIRELAREDKDAVIDIDINILGKDKKRKEKIKLI